MDLQIDKYLAGLAQKQYDECIDGRRRLLILSERRIVLNSFVGIRCIIVTVESIGIGWIKAGKLIVCGNTKQFQKQ